MIAEEPKTAELSPERLAAVRAHLHDVLSGDAFKGSKRAQDFLQLVVEHALAGRVDSLRERMLGVEMFGRAIDYDTANDAVVRVKASEVRRRLGRHYDSLDTPPPVRIALSTGSYVPQFQWAEAETSSIPDEALENQVDPILVSTPPADVPNASPAGALQRASKRRLLGAALLMAYSAVLILLTWFAVAHFGVPHQAPKPTDQLWAALFENNRNTFIVPADAGFNLLEDMAQRPIPLAEYVNGGYLAVPLPEINPHGAKDLHSGRYGSFVDIQIVSQLSRLPAYNPQRTSIRFPRDLKPDDLKNANAILLGSVGSNPWVSIAGHNTNFQIVPREGMEGASIVNTNPQSGEAASYESHWNEPQHDTFALIAFLPNLSGNGHLLLLQGLDAAGTQAAAEMLFDSPAMSPILQRATRPDGSIRFFEILVRSTSIDSSSTGTEVIASRIY